jgi:DNA-binding GntR family transcriptional regulator
MTYNIRTILITGRSERTIAEHWDIYKAIKARDIDKAVKYIRQHLSSIRKLFEENFRLLQ